MQRARQIDAEEGRMDRGAAAAALQTPVAEKWQKWEKMTPSVLWSIETSGADHEGGKRAEWPDLAHDELRADASCGHFGGLDVPLSR